MCGRFSLSTPTETLAEYFELAEVPRLTPRYNVAPTQAVAVIRDGPRGGGRRLDLLHWGLVPRWAKDRRMGARMINARSETAATKPAFRSAFRRRRCLVAADGFFEWRSVGGRKEPMFFRMVDGAPFGLAGLWEHWQAPDGQALESCTILTTKPSALVAPIHDRMPVIVAREDFALWLDPGVQEPSSVLRLLVPFEADTMTCHRVSTRVNSPRNDDPECVR